MKYFLLFTLIITISIAAGCGENIKQSNKPEPAANTEPKKIEDGFYTGKGVVTKIDLQLGTVELDHEEITGLMPAMKMEFPVKEKAMLKGFVVGDSVLFTFEYKEGKQTIIAIGK